MLRDGGIAIAPARTAVRLGGDLFAIVGDERRVG
jgi:hypothetical protein